MLHNDNMHMCRWSHASFEIADDDEDSVSDKRKTFVEYAAHIVHSNKFSCEQSMNIFSQLRSSGFERVRTPNRTCPNLNLAFRFGVQKITEPEHKFRFSVHRKPPRT